MNMRCATSSADPARKRGTLVRPAILLLLLPQVVGCGDSQRTPAQLPDDSTRELGIEVEHMDRSVRPQDDFFRYVNGTWLEQTEIPADKASYGSFQELADRSEAHQKQIIEEAAAKPAGERTQAEQQVGDLFLSFMDTARVNELGLKPIQKYLAEVDALENREQIAAYLADAYRVGVEGPITFYVNVDYQQPDTYAVYFTQSGLGLPDRDYYFRDDDRSVAIREKYVAFIAKVLDLAGDEQSEELADRIMAMERLIADGQWTRVENRDRNKTYNKYAVADLGELTPNFSWQSYLAQVDLGTLPHVVIRQPTYLQKLDSLFSSVSLAEWKLYLKWQVINTYVALLSSPFDLANFEFYGRTLRGTEIQRERWKRAVALVNRSIGELVGQIYVARHFKPEAKARMEQLVENLFVAFRQGIDELAWMGPETKREARKKLAGFVRKIGYPDKWRDYSALQIDPHDLVGNYARVNAFEMDYEIGKLGKPIDRTEWQMTPQTVNAYYSPALNEIAFPAAILQPPFFNPAADDAVNYGAIGAVIGHEISHGFDDQGRKSDGEGRLRDWWTEADAAAFEERAARLVAQYNDLYPLPDLHINGELTLGENIGDLSGVAIAYKAYQISLKGKPAPVIDGFTGDQRFFLGYAQMWREKMREEAIATTIQTNPHAPGEYRVRGVLTNMTPFQEAFDVREGDALWRPPEERVTIW